jgi:hypothetical protein
MPEGFKRPSFFVQFIQETETNLNRWVYERAIPLEIVYFSPLDDYSNRDITDQDTVYETVKGLFSDGYITVGDRARKISQITGGPRNNEIYLNLQIDTTESRTEPTYDTVHTVTTTIKETT